MKITLTRAKIIVLLVLIPIVLIHFTETGMQPETTEKKGKQGIVKRNNPAKYTTPDAIRSNIPGFYRLGKEDYGASSFGMYDSFLMRINISVDELLEQEEMIVAFLEDSKYKRSEKIEALIQLKQGTTDVNAKGILLDWIDVMLPIEHVNTLMDGYYDTEDSGLKRKYLSVIENSLNITNNIEELSEKDLRLIAQQTEKIELAVRDIIEQATAPPDLMNYLARKIPNIYMSEEAYALLDKLQDERAISEETATTAKLSAAFSTEEAQEGYVNDILGEIEGADDEQMKIRLNDRLYIFLEMGGISETVKEEVTEYLNKNEPPRVYDPNKYNDYLEWLENRYHWVEAKSGLDIKAGMEIDGAERAKYMAGEILKTNEPMHQANIIIYADREVFTIINERGQYEEVMASLSTAMENREISGNEKQLYENAIGRIKEESGESTGRTEEESETRTDESLLPPMPFSNVAPPPGPLLQSPQ